MAVIDSLIVEVLADTSGLSNGLAKAESRIKEFDQTVGVAGKSLTKLAGTAGAVVGSVTAIYAALNSQMASITKQADELHARGIFSKDELDRAKEYRDILASLPQMLSDVYSKASFMVADAAFSKANPLGGIGMAIGTAIGNEYVPTNMAPIDRSKLLAPGSRKGAWEGIETSQAQSEAAFGTSGRLSGFLRDMHGALTKSLESLGPAASAGEDALFGLQTKQWAWQGQLSEKNKRRDAEREMQSLPTRSGITLGNTMEGYRELHSQTDQTKKLVSETEKQTDFLDDILGVLRQTDDPFA